MSASPARASSTARDRAVPVEAVEPQVGDRRSGLSAGSIVQREEALDRHALPAEAGGRPPRDAVEVGGDLLAREIGERDLRHRGRLADGGADSAPCPAPRRGRVAEVRAEAREPVERALAGGERHAAATALHLPPDLAQHQRVDEEGRNGAIAAM